MTDRELLELAAKACELEEAKMRIEFNQWNPIDDDGDALRLAVKLEMQVSIGFRRINVSFHTPSNFCFFTGGEPAIKIREENFEDPLAATRRAIVRAAVEIGRNHCGEIDDVQKPPLPVQPEPVTWDKPSDHFNEWWNGDYEDPANPFEKDSAAHWAYEGWQAALAQRPWVGLTDEEIKALASWWPSYDQMPALMVLAKDIQNSLKEKNT